MFAVYLVILSLSVVRAAKLQYCQELVLKGTAPRKDVATLVFTMDSTCVACYHEIQKLVRLQTQMARLGHNADIMVALDQLPKDRKHQMPSEVTVDLEDAWTKLGRLNGHIFVFDKCRKLAYQVITPWSRQVYPFTAMAGLSALYDAPCGECNVTSPVADELQEIPVSLDRLGSQGNEVTLKITNRESRDDINKGVPLETNNPNFHVLQSTQSEIKDSKTNASEVLNNATKTAEGSSHIPQEGTTSDIKSSISQAMKTGASQDVKNGISQDGKSAASTTETNREPPSSQDDYNTLLKRYQPLMKWRKCANVVMSIQV